MPTPIFPISQQIDPRTVRTLCPAKINLALSVGAPRPDGMHPIASWMRPITLADTLTLRRIEGPSRFDITFAGNAPVQQRVDWPVLSDLTYRAHLLMERHVGHALPVEATLEKRIPAGAGLGGGSADAAGMLLALSALFQLKLDTLALMDLASQLGSDVMFQLQARHGLCGAIVTGVGEEIELLLRGQPQTLLLVLPPFGCSTPAVYRAFDQSLSHSETSSPDIDRVRQLTRIPLDTGTPLFNDLAEPACVVQPELRNVLERLRGFRLAPHVTGSGSAVFCLIEDGYSPEGLRELLDEVAEATGCATTLTELLR